MIEYIKVDTAGLSSGSSSLFSQNFLYRSLERKEVVT
jgi:hypothetical protein